MGLRRHKFLSTLRVLREWNEWKFFREAPRPPAGAPVALISCMGDWEYTTKVEMMLGLGLRLEGWRVVYLLKDRSLRLAPRWLRCGGFDEILFFSDFQREIPAQEMAAYMKEIRAAGESFEAVKTWSFRGCLVGPQILASISRKIFSAGFDITAPDVRDKVNGQLWAAVTYVLAAEKLLAELQPAVLALTEANYTFSASLVDAAIRRGARVIQFLQPNREDAVTLWRLDRDTRRTHPATVSAKSLQRVTQSPWTDAHDREVDELFANRYGGKWYLQSRNQIATAEMDRARICEELKLDPGKPLAIVFSAVLWDANLFYGRDLFKDNGEWFVETVRAACANDRVNWAVKLHPVNTWKRELEGVSGELAEYALVRDNIGPLPAHVKLLPPECGISTHSLFHHADFGVIIRGTSGMEMPCFGKTVVTAGTGRYSGLGFTIDSETREEYLAWLARMPDIPRLDDDQIRLARQHFYAAFRLRPWIMKSFEAIMSKPKGPGDLDYARLRPRVRSIDELRANGDLHKWADWVIRGETPDYLEASLLA